MIDDIRYLIVFAKIVERGSIPGWHQFAGDRQIDAGAV